MVTTKITRKWQVTIPAEIREQFDVKQGETLVVTYENDAIQMKKMTGVGARTAGALSAYAKNMPTLEPGEIRELVAQHIAEEVERSMRENE